MSKGEFWFKVVSPVTTPHGDDWLAWTDPGGEQYHVFDRESPNGIWL
jgi:hypothetical protein